MTQRLDGNYAWAVAFASFLVIFCVLGSAKTSGVLFVYLQSEYNASHAATAAISLTQRIMEAVGALFFTFIAERFGSRPVMLVGSTLLVSGTLCSVFVTTIVEMTISFGVVVGLGMAMLHYPAVQILPKYFDKNLAIVSAFVYLGAAIGPLCLPHLITYSIAIYGLSGSFFIIAAVYAQSFVSAMLMRPVGGSKNVGSGERCDSSTIAESVSFKSTFEAYLAGLRNWPLLLYYFCHLSGKTSGYAISTYQQAHAHDRGFSDPDLLALLTTLWGIAEITSKIIFGFLLHYSVIQPYRLHQFAAVVMAVTLAIYPLLTSYWAIASAGALVGFCFSAEIATFVATIRLIVGIDRCGPAIGLICLPDLVAYVIVQLGGLARDKTGSFTFIFYVCSVLLLLSIISLEIIAHKIGTSVITAMQNCRKNQVKERPTN